MKNTNYNEVKRSNALEQIGKYKKAELYNLILFALFLIWAIVLKFNIESAVTQSILGIRLLDMNFGERLRHFLLSFPPPEVPDMIANVLVFIPLGFLLVPTFKKNSIAKSIVLCFFVSLSFEIFQILTLFGGFMYTDILCNTMGGILGAVFRNAFLKRISSVVYDGIVIGAGILQLSVIIFALINTCIHIDIYFV